MEKKKTELFTFYFTDTVSGVTARTLEMTVDEGEDKAETEEQRTQTANMVSSKCFQCLLSQQDQNSERNFQFRCQKWRAMIGVENSSTGCQQ